MKSIQKILSHVRSAVDDYSMIEEGDRIAVGVSGGKDSMTLLCALKELSRFYPKRFELFAVCLNVGFPGGDISPVTELCEKIEVPLTVIDTDIYEIVFINRKEKCPCSLCARMRRGALHDAAKALNCNKVALGHHFDDAVETLMLNLFNEGRIGCFSPVTFLDRKQITLIRPLIYTPEKMMTYFINKEGIRLSPKVCPEDGNTDREKIKNLLFDLSKDDKGLMQRIFGAMQRRGIDGWGIDKKETDDQ